MRHTQWQAKSQKELFVCCARGQAHRQECLYYKTRESSRRAKILGFGAIARYISGETLTICCKWQKDSPNSSRLPMSSSTYCRLSPISWPQNSSQVRSLAL